MLSLQIRCLATKAGQEDGNHPTRQVRLHILRKDDRKETFRWYLELQVMQEDRRWRSIHSLVRTQSNQREYWRLENYPEDETDKLD
jgi:hypothetical protein